MARLPTPGADENDWGDILNEFIRVGHREDGQLRNTWEVADVRDFGAAFNGVADDTAAIQAAIDSVSPRGGTVVLPEGTAILSSALNVPGKVNLKGQGILTTYLKLTDFSDFGIKVMGTDNNRQSRCLFEDFCVDGDNQTSPMGAIHYQYTHSSYLKRVAAIKMGNPSCIAFDLQNCFRMYFERAHAFLGSNGVIIGTGLRLHGEASGMNCAEILFVDCMMQYCQTGFDLSSYGTSTFYSFNVILLDCETTGAAYAVKVGDYIRNIVIDGMNIEDDANHDSQYGIYVRPASSDTTFNIDIRNNFFWSIPTAIYARDVDVINVYNNSFGGNGTPAGTVIDLDDSCSKVKWYDNQNYRDWYNIFAVDVDPRHTKVRGYLNADQDGLVDNAWNTVLFDAADWDAKAEIDMVSHGFTAKKTGYYRLFAQVVLHDLTIGSRIMAHVYKNGTTEITRTEYRATHPEYLTLQLQDEYYLEQGDFIEVRIYPGSVGTGEVDINGGRKITYFIVESSDAP